MSLRQCLDCRAVKQEGTLPYGDCPKCGGPTVHVDSDRDTDDACQECGARILEGYYLCADCDDEAGEQNADRPVQLGDVWAFQDWAVVFTTREDEQADVTSAYAHVSDMPITTYPHSLASA